MTLTEELENIAGFAPDDLSDALDVDIYTEQLAFEIPEGAGRRRPGRLALARAGSLASGAALLGGASLASIIAASALRRERPLAGIEAIARGIGTSRPRWRRRRGRLAAPVGLVGAAVIAGGALALAGLQRGISGMARGRAPWLVRLGSVVLVPVAAYAIDRTLMTKRLVPELRKVLGPRGLFAKYASMGLASALVAR